MRYALSAGIRQFVDIGSGLPATGAVREIADHYAPGQAHVVYVDNEPIAHAHASILLAHSADPGRHHAIDADFYDATSLWQ